MDLTQTRTSLHAVAELLLAGPQYDASGDIRLRVVPGGFGTVALPDLRVVGSELVGPGGRHPLSGTYAAAAAALGVSPRRLDAVYSDTVEVEDDDEIVTEASHVAVLVEAFARGDAALRAFAPSEEPVLWPEHFDIGITLAEVNYGVSPGDSTIPEPYAYVGPWAPRQGEFWNHSFGAARPLTELVDVRAFFSEGARRATNDPPA
ncbi:hypothetical protein SAMN04489867_0851 [Pedococcus dokdonensis]|uniref:Uncharacterized protein n=1 Tax=Pedococcus dokdonensis TaxID=443156 RepID=A0A1H0N7X8_9MICO|nr:hypothetical protein [Pedococcus dokdonensis]SDO88440.1 hypothetical protein SAMN04489867_0851 [Pedococcus dokdonensis]